MFEYHGWCLKLSNSISIPVQHTKKDFVANNNGQLFTNGSAESLSGIQISNKVLGILTKMLLSSFYYSTN